MRLHINVVSVRLFLSSYPSCLSNGAIFLCFWPVCCVKSSNMEFDQRATDMIISQWYEHFYNRRWWKEGIIKNKIQHQWNRCMQSDHNHQSTLGCLCVDPSGFGFYIKCKRNRAKEREKKPSNEEICNTHTRCDRSQRVEFFFIRVFSRLPCECNAVRPANPTAKWWNACDSFDWLASKVFCVCVQAYLTYNSKRRSKMPIRRWNGGRWTLSNNLYIR